MLDQAAGLRRRRGAALPLCILAFLASPDSTRHLAQALGARGLSVLLVDAQGRLLADAPRSLFDWRVQLARAQLHTVPHAGAHAWYAPGLAADVHGLDALAQGHDALLIDVGLDTDRLALMRGARHAIAIEAVSPAFAAPAYARLKTLAGAEDVANVALLGDPGTCERLQAACARFLGAAFACKVDCVPGEDAPFTALAVRMTGEEAGSRTRYKTGTPLEHGR